MFSFSPLGNGVAERAVGSAPQNDSQRDTPGRGSIRTGSWGRGRRCENGLKSTAVDENGKKTERYYHRGLGAKLVISQRTEFIENESEDV